MPLLRDLLNAFGDELTRNFAAAEMVPAQAEDQLKPPTVRLLQDAGPLLDVGDVVARTEALATEFAAKPDLGVSVRTLLTGHIELKAPGKGARAHAFTESHDKAQFKKLLGHPNLVYTDGNEWALYRLGALTGESVRSAGDVRADGRGTYSDADCEALERLLRDFFLWQPLVPNSPLTLARAIAPLTRLLRETVQELLAEPTTALSALAEEWRGVLFADADDAEFADAYAQTLTYALLLARVEGEEDLHARAADRLDARHGLLAQVLRVLAQPDALREVEAPVSLLERVIAAIDPAELERRARGRDIWLYFYEDFLAAYDPKLRKQRGVYFTPPQVVKAQIALVDELLEDRFGRALGIADDGVTVLDPAVGTGTYLLAALEKGIDRIAERFGEGAIGGRATSMAANLNGFELLVGSYSVAHLRLAQEILQLGGALPDDGPHIYLADTLESPNAAPPHLAHAPLFERRLALENERARRVKAEVPVLVCIGNPPYFRQVIHPDEDDRVERQGGWVRYGDEGEAAILDDFIRGTPPLHVKNLYNLYVYFWRWALWKVFESPSSGGSGIVSFITASSYLVGPGFAGMRRHMREQFDELWVLDLGGDDRSARKSENVFDIQTPVAIALGTRYPGRDHDDPAVARFARLEGSREEKFEVLDSIRSLADIEWRECSNDWTAPLLPESAGAYLSWPALTDIFPWQHSGAQYKRTWPIAPDRETLLERWQTLVEAQPARRAALFRESRDRKTNRAYRSLTDATVDLPAIQTLTQRDAAVPPVRYGFRSFDRQFCIPDSRVGDFLRPVLWRTALSGDQLFMTSLLTGLLGEGPAATVSHLVPDLHHFRGSFGGKDVIPLWRDRETRTPNVTEGLLERVRELVGLEVSALDLFAYCYSILAAPSYSTRFWDELWVPGSRVPLTSRQEHLTSGIDLGRRLIWLHTYGERLVPDGHRAGQVPQGDARNVRAIPMGHESYPSEFAYDPEGQVLSVGEGTFAPVSVPVFEYAVSGFPVVASWLAYRMRDGAGRRSSPLDEIRPQSWTGALTEELLALLWVLEFTVALGPELDRLLDTVVREEVIPADALPEPEPYERLAPA